MAKILVPRITTGLPSSIKGRPRADMRPDEFAKLIDTKGYRVWWSRTSICPCRNNDQTDQADVSCTLCKGDGWFEHLPDDALGLLEVDGYGNPMVFNEARTAVMVMIWASSATRDPQIFERFGDWAFGMAKATFDGANKPGYRDRVEVIDAVMPWSQLAVADGSAKISVTRNRGKQRGLQYGAVDVYMLRSLATVYRRDQDYRVGETGEIEWLVTPPPEGTVLSVHYLVHPIFRVMDHAFVFRDTNAQKYNKAETKAEEHTCLPTQVLLKLEYL